MGSWKGIYFRGRGILIPGAYCYVDTEAMVPDRKSPANTIGAVGMCKGGKPNTLLRVTSLAEAAAILRDGDLKRAAELMYNPSSDVPGAGNVVFVRVDAAATPIAQAALAISTQLNLKSVDYGAHNNFLRMKIEAGSTSGNKITIEHMADGTIEIQDNLGNLFTIQYTGSGTTVTMTIDSPVTTLTIIEDAADLVVLDLLTYPTNTVKGIVEALDSNPDLTCTLDVDGDGTYTASLLEEQSTVDIKASPVVVDGEVGTVHYWLNTYSSLVESVLGASPIGSVSAIPWTNFASGNDGSAPTTSDWTAAIDLLATETDIKLVYTTAEDAAIHAAVDAHCALMSDIKTGKERIQICGGAASEAASDAVTRAVNLGSNRSCLVFPGVKRYNLTTGVLDTLSPALTAAIIAGMAGGVEPEIPLTFKTIKAQGIEKVLTDTEVELLLAKGVMPLRYVREDSIYHVVQSITTWQKDANVIKRKLSGMRIHDYLAQEVRNTANPFVGKIADATSMISIKNAIEAKLDLLTRGVQNPTGILTPGLVDGELLPSYTNLTVNYDGLDWVTISFEAHPVGEIAYITIEAKLKPSRMSV